MNKWKWITLLLLITSLMFCMMFFISCQCTASGTDDSGDDDDIDNRDVDDDYTTTDDDDNDSDDDDTSIEDGVWVDETSGLMWENRDYNAYLYRWDKAKSYCQNLNSGVYDDWRMPTISELRSLIRGCEGTETKGACCVTDSCLDSNCWNESCFSCLSSHGCYWPSELKGECDHYWSKSAVADVGGDAWGVNFDYGYIYNNSMSGSGNVRCVRDAD